MFSVFAVVVIKNTQNMQKSFDATFRPAISLNESSTSGQVASVALISLQDQVLLTSGECEATVF